MPTTQHTAYDLDLFVPDPARPALEACARSFAALSSPPATHPTAPSPTGPDSLAASPPTSTAPTAGTGTGTVGEQLASLDAQIALDALATTSHLRQLHALLAFARDPVSFLDHFVASQAGSLDQVLASSSSSSTTTAAPVAMDKVLGERWRDEIRKSENWESSPSPSASAADGARSAWLEDAIAVWAMREKEGEAQRLRQQRQQQHAAQQQQQFGRR